MSWKDTKKPKRVKIANIKTLTENPKYNPSGVVTPTTMSLALQRAASDGAALARDGRAVAKFMPNKKGFRIVNGEYVPRKQK